MVMSMTREGRQKNCHGYRNERYIQGVLARATESHPSQQAGGAVTRGDSPLICAG